MNSHRLTHDDLTVVEHWLNHAENISPPIAEILSRALTHLSHLLNQDMSRADLVKYLRMQMGIEPKSEKLGSTSSSNQSTGSAIFRR